MNILCIGDSHTRFLDFRGFFVKNCGRKAAPRVFAHPLTAASALGFSKGRASRFAWRAAARVSKTVEADHYVFCFGQVDAEVGHYYRRFVALKDESAEASFDRIYTAYLDEVVSFCGDTPVVIKGINPTTLAFDSSLQNHVFMNIAKRITDQGEREAVQDRVAASGITVATHAAQNVLANDILKAKVVERGLRWFDVRDAIETAPGSGLARIEFLNIAEDVHLINSLYVQKLHYDALMGVILEGTPS